MLDGARTRAVHVDVDPEAWGAFKIGAIRRGTTVGEAVGELVDGAVRRRGADLAQAVAGTTNCGRRGEPGEGRRARKFSRIAVDDDTWRNLRVQAMEHDLTVARAVGALVELAVGLIGSGRIASGAVARRPLGSPTERVTANIVQAHDDRGRQWLEAVTPPP
jgi:hypothetical protein